MERPSGSTGPSEWHLVEQDSPSGIFRVVPATGRREAARARHGLRPITSAAMDLSGLEITSTPSGTGGGPVLGRATGIGAVIRLPRTVRPAQTVSPYPMNVGRTRREARSDR
jgi:hypothetical protein